MNPSEVPDDLRTAQTLSAAGFPTGVFMLSIDSRMCSPAPLVGYGEILRWDRFEIRAQDDVGRGRFTASARNDVKRDQKACYMSY